MNRIIRILLAMLIALGGIAPATAGQIVRKKTSTGSQAIVVLPKICNASGCYSFLDQSILILKKQIPILTGASGLIMPTFNSVVFENADCKKEKDALDKQLSEKYKVYTDKVNELVKQKISKKDAEKAAKTEYDAYAERKKTNYNLSKLCYSYRTKNKSAIDKKLAKQLGDYKIKLEKHNSNAGFYSGLQAFWTMCDPKGMSGAESQMHQLLSKGGWSGAKTQIITLEKIIKDCMITNATSRPLQDQRFLKIIRLMYARLLFLKGYTTIANGMLPGQLNPDMDDAKMMLEQIIRDNDPLLIGQAKKLYRFVEILYKK